MMQNFKKVWTAGFAMFSMFFGSGNLVFPFLIGTLSASNYIGSILGLIITGILVPFLGLLTVLCYDGNYKNLFYKLGVTPANILCLIMLSLMGPFGVGARCVTVAYAGIHLIIPTLPIIGFNIGFCGLVLALVWFKSSIINIIGKVLTPFLLIGITIVIIGGIVYGPNPTDSQVNTSTAFKIGLVEGYQTMDLLAAFFFSTEIYKYLKARTHSSKSLGHLALGSSCLGVTLLSVVYIGFVYLGAQFGSELVGVSPDYFLVHIAQKTLGRYAMPVAALTIAMACLTTVLILVELFADFVHKELTNRKLSRHFWLTATVFITFIVSLTGFSRLKIWLAGALEIAYPALIAFAVGGILHKKVTHRVNPKYWFYTVLLVSGIIKCM